MLFEIIAKFNGPNWYFNHTKQFLSQYMPVSIACQRLYDVSGKAQVEIPHIHSDPGPTLLDASKFMVLPAWKTTELRQRTAIMEFSACFRPKTRQRCTCVRMRSRAVRKSSTCSEEKGEKNSFRSIHRAAARPDRIYERQFWVDQKNFYYRCSAYPERMRSDRSFRLCRSC